MTRVLVAALVVSVLPALAQTSGVQGTVADGQGALIPQVVVSATNEETSASRKTVTTETGAYSFVQLPPGPYRIEAQKPGFRTSVQQVRLQVNTPVTLNIAMEVGQVTETVNVSAEAVAVNTQNATVGNPFTEVQIRQLPLQTRNIVELLALQPGVAPSGEVLGARRDQNNVVLDGIDVNDPQLQLSSNQNGFTAALPVPLDSVQEFRTTVAGQGADQGRSSGGQVALVTKGGSNAFHGSLYEFHRNRVTAANTWFSNRSGVARENLIRNQYGASLGGRLIRDRAFFFVNWEDRKDRSALAVTRTVPTETLKQGIVQFRMSNGQIGSLTPAEIRSADPLGQGVNPYALSLLQQYPVGNDLAQSADRGLNFAILRFNAPVKRNFRTYVAKFDFNLDSAGKHTLSLRGTLADNAEDNDSGTGTNVGQNLAQFPGQSAQSLQLNNSKGLAARYTTVLTTSLINNFNYGYTRIGSETSGAGGFAPSFYFTNLAGSFPRSVIRAVPTHNIVNDLTWNKERHTVQGGINFRFVTNDRTTNTTWPTYSFSRNTLQGLGNDITEAVTQAARQKFGNSALTLTEGVPLTNAMGALLGVINSYSVAYNYGRDGQSIPIGSPILRSYGSKEYEFYLQDQFKMRSDLTLTYGVRYGVYETPYERNGVQVVSRTPLNQFFAERVGGSALGIPGAALPSAQLTYELGGPANGGPGWYATDKNNWAPRVALAYAPGNDSFASKFMGNGSVFRVSGGVVYDRYGNNLANSFATSGSPGLATTVNQPVNTNFSTSVRYNGSNLPALPAAPAGGLPFTPATIVGGFNSYVGITPDLRAPYSYLLNGTYSRPLPKSMVVEVGYIGRLSRKGLLRQDFGQPLTQFRDPQSGQTWTQASGQLRDLRESGITPAQVRANPSLLPTIPFFENLFAKAANRTFPGSATANYFNSVYQTYAGSDLDALSDMDRSRLADGSCISAYGCNTFFALQSAGLQSWVNASNASYHGGQLTFRRPVQGGWGFDFNYTLSHSIDIASSSEADNGGLIQDAFNPAASRASSDFDIRHNITTNTVVELPFGRNKRFMSSIPTFVDQIVGGWQISVLGRFRSGLPYSIINDGRYPTNYLTSAIAVIRPGQTMPATGVGYNQNTDPSIFGNTNALNSFMGQYPGTVGTRNIVRGDDLLNFDLSVGKYFTLPFEGVHRIQLRAEAFNAFNNVNFRSLQLNLNTPGTFGRFEAAEEPRVIQFALRYEF